MGNLPILHILIALLLCILKVKGNSNGFTASDELCKTMLPKGASAQSKSNSPYAILINKDNYDVVMSGEPIAVMLTGHRAFKGFLVISKDSADGEISYGTFNKFNSTSGVKPIDCFGKPGSAVTHNNNEDKYVVSFDWTFPVGDHGGHGYYKLMATFMENENTFWHQEVTHKIFVQNRS